ncbi:DUF3253 domain-containing protein [Skermanella sp. TT6]|uniref:DUF3253 domain-containing protein n=1 Tax=Skermanella cutis TaxID=2775420 RepID=A0ABX7B659_9PROT|nr:DUF3253 domain-containing protein [Skermanella sp. TT6]QQP87976.1 DUF3253 domain-containing protein [Skermanella sp. TT6]
MTDDASKNQKPDPITERILAMIEDGGSVSPQEVAQAFYKDTKTPGMPADGWHKYMTAVRQQAIHLARQGRLQITRKGEPVDPNNFKGVVRLRKMPPAQP